MYFHQVFPHCSLKTERKFTDQNYCTFEDRYWPDRRQRKGSSAVCSCQKGQECSSAAINSICLHLFPFVLSLQRRCGSGQPGRRPPTAISSQPTLDGNASPACGAGQRGLPRTGPAQPAGMGSAQHSAGTSVPAEARLGGRAAASDLLLGGSPKGCDTPARDATAPQGM